MLNRGNPDVDAMLGKETECQNVEGKGMLGMKHESLHYSFFLRFFFFSFFLLNAEFVASTDTCVCARTVHTKPNGDRVIVVVPNRR